MSTQFHSHAEPSDLIFKGLESAAPRNPFYTKAYSDAIRGPGTTVVALTLESDGIDSGCIGYLKSGRLNRRFDIVSVPKPSDADVFWKGLEDFCRTEKIDILKLDTFGSDEVDIAMFRGESERIDRFEYHLDLTGGVDLEGKLHRRARRNWQVAGKAGCTIRRSTTEFVSDHVLTSNSSLQRRKMRGESIEYLNEETQATKFLDNGIGEIFQAVYEGEVASSLLVVKSSKGVYAQTSGTTDEGFRLGASHFLWHETAKLLQQEGYELFNLGGVTMDAKGLRQFKESFAPIRINLQAVSFYLGSKMKRSLSSLAEKIS